MYVPKNPHLPKTPTKKLTYLTGLSFAAATLLCLAVIVLSFQYVSQVKIANNKQREIDTLSTTLQTAMDQYTKVKRELIMQNALPPLGSFSQQCPNGNEEDGLFMPLNTSPIEGYNVFLVDCRSTISTGKSAPRILVFKVNNDGTKEYIYGASDAEPLCVSNKIPVANKLAVKLRLPVCASN